MKKKTMIIGGTKDNTYCMPECMLNKHGFYIGKNVIFETNGKDSIIARQV